MRVLTLALLFILSCSFMMNWQSDCHKQQQTYLAMSDDNEHTSLQSVLVDGHQQGHILPSSSSLVNSDSNLSKDILGTKTTSRANDHGGVILIGRETFICDVLDTEDSRYKRIAPGLKWIFQKIFFRENLSICPLIFWVIHHQVEDDIRSFEEFIDNDNLDPNFEWTATNTNGSGESTTVKFCLSSFDLHELQLF